MSSIESALVVLVPEAEALVNLTLAICERYPENPPYGGKFTDVIPHLIVAHAQNEADLDRIAEDFTLAARGILPITATAEDVALMDNRSGDWQICDVCALGRMHR